MSEFTVVYQQSGFISTVFISNRYLESLMVHVEGVKPECRRKIMRNDTSTKSVVW